MQKRSTQILIDYLHKYQLMGEIKKKTNNFIFHFEQRSSQSK